MASTQSPIAFPSVCQYICLYTIVAITRERYKQSSLNLTQIYFLVAGPQTTTVFSSGDGDDDVSDDGCDAHGDGQVGDENQMVPNAI